MYESGFATTPNQASRGNPGPLEGWVLPSRGLLWPTSPRGSTCHGTGDTRMNQCILFLDFAIMIKMLNRFDLTANDEASLAVSRGTGARVPLRGVTARRTRHGDTTALLLQQTYNLDEGVHAHIILAHHHHATMHASPTVSGMHPTRHLPTGWYIFNIAFLKQASPRADDAPLLRLSWSYSDPTLADDEHDDERNGDDPPEELPPQDVLPSMLFRARAPTACLYKPLGDIGDLVDDLTLAPEPGALNSQS